MDTIYILALLNYLVEINVVAYFKVTSKKIIIHYVKQK